MSAPKWDAEFESWARAYAREEPGSNAAIYLAEIDRLRAECDKLMSQAEGARRERDDARTLASARQTACDELRRERDALIAHQNEMGRRDTADRRFELVKAVLKSGKLYDTRLADFSGTVAVRLADEALAALNAPKASEAPHVCARDPLDVIAREYVEFMAGRIDDGYARENANSSTDIGHLSILHRYHVARRDAQEKGK